jgi:REP element-mobilizing transposase RayT
VIKKWKDELASSEPTADLQKALHQRIAHYEDAGHGSLILLRQDCAEIIQSQLINGDPGHYHLIEWCIMPNHVHVLIKLHESSSLAKIVQSWKGKSACLINRLLERKGALWQREYYDRYIRDQDHYHDCRSYIRNNPVKASLCKHPEDWPYSSAGIKWEMERWL